MDRRFSFFLLFSFFFVFACSNNPSDGNVDASPTEIDCSENSPAVVKKIEIPPDRTWVNSGITLKKGYEIVIEVEDERTFGKEEVSFSNPVVFAGKNAIIFKIGEKGVPQPVGRKFSFVAGSEHENKDVLLGWNSIEPVIAKRVTETGDVIIEKPESITAVIKVFLPLSDKLPRRPVLYAPVDNFWTDETNPRFYWDPIDNAIRYIFQISDYPDFRRVVQNIEISASGGQANPVSVIGGGASQEVQFNLREGIYWWRVIAQVNVGRALNPIPVWTCWSHPFRLGVELGTPPQPPNFVSPTTADVFKPGDSVTFEFVVNDDPSFVFWRWRHVYSDCDQQPSINPNDPNSGNPTPWHIGRVKLGEGNIKDLPKIIGSFTYRNIETGNHLFRVEVRDGQDIQEIAIRSRDFRLSVGCESGEK